MFEPIRIRKHPYVLHFLSISELSHTAHFLCRGNSYTKYAAVLIILEEINACASVRKKVHNFWLRNQKRERILIALYWSEATQFKLQKKIPLTVGVQRECIDWDYGAALGKGSPVCFLFNISPLRPPHLFWEQQAEIWSNAECHMWVCERHTTLWWEPAGHGYG